MSNVPSVASFPSSPPPSQAFRARPVAGPASVAELTEDERATLQALIRQHTAERASRLLGVSRNALTTAAAGGGTRRGTVLLIRTALRSLGR